MTALPTFISSCIAPDSDGQNAFLFGVPSPGTLEAHRVNLANPLTPTSTLVSSTSTSTGNGKWDASSSLGCYSYLGDTPSSLPVANSTALPPAFPPPITIVQFGNTIQTQFFPNGTWATFETTTEAAFDYLSPKLFSPVGSTNGWNWFLGRAAGQSKTWRNIRIASRTESGAKDLTIAGSEPLLTVGAIAPDVNNFGNGLLFFIDQSGSSGSIYRATGNKRPAANLTATDTLVTLSKPSPLNMNSNTLTVDAVPVTSAFAAFILDKSDQGVISVYSIDPRVSTLTLTRTPVKGFSPLFQPTQSFTSLNSRIVVYGGAVPNAIHIFDVISGTWTGPALVDPAAVNTEIATKGPSMGIIGGIAAAAVILLIVIGLVIWRVRRRRRATKSTIDIPPINDDIKVPVNENTIDLLTLENKSKPRLGDHKQSSSTTLIPTTAPSSMPGTPASQYKKRHSSQQRRPGGVSRHASAYSIQSNGSQSKIYLAGPATVLPSNPAIPSAYSTTNLQQLQNAAAVYRSTSAPGTPNPRSADPPSRKGSVYKFSVPNDYDDRQPLHHHESSEEQQAYLQMSRKSSPSASPASLSGSRPLEAASSTTLGNSYSHNHSLPSQSQSDASGNYPRPSFSSTSQPASPKQPRPSTSTLDSEHQSQSSQQSQQQATSSARSTSRPRKKRTDGAAPLKSPTSPTSLKEFSSSKYADRRDSGSYKVECRDGSSYQKQQQQYSHSSPASPTSTYTPLTSSKFAPSTPTTLSSSPMPSDTNTHFTESFPMPPKMVVPKPHKRAAPAPPRSGSGSTSASSVMSGQPAPSRTSREQQQQQQLQQQLQWLEGQYHQQQQQQQQMQHEQQQVPSGRDGIESVAGSVGTMSPKTPKLVSLPRPIPREREREHERSRN